MPIDDRRRELWQLVEQHRGRISLHDLPSLVDGLEQLGHSLDYEDLAFLSQRLNRHFGGGFMPPTSVCRFIVELLASREALAVLDPVAGEGWLTARITSLGRAARVVSVTPHPLAPWLANKLRLDRLSIVQREPEGTATFDAIVSMPPMYGVSPERRVTRDGRGEVCDTPGLLRLLEVADGLSDGGLIAWIVPPKFAFNNSPQSVRRNLHRYGLHLSGMIQIAPGAFAPTTPMSFDLALIERTRYDNLFVAALPEEAAAQDELIARFRDRREGPQPSQGRLVTEKTFFGLAALEAADRAARLAERRGLTAIRFSELIVEVNRPRRRNGALERLPHHPDALYLPEMARTDAATQQELLPDRLQSYLQLVVNREKVDPEYLARLLNSPLGHAIRESARGGLTIPRIARERLLAAIAYLPPPTDQTKSIEVLKAVRLLRSELEELEAQVWEKPRRVSELLDRVSRVNHEDRFQDWVETLPFPLASILRAYHAVDRGDKEKYERLLHFFEALAAFVATIHISALRADVNRWLTFQENSTRQFAQNHFSWSRPTFGMWRTVIEIAAPLVRPMLNGGAEEQQQILTLYETADPTPIEFLVAGQLLGLLQETNQLRNRWSGHGGAVSSVEAVNRHREILDHLNTFRSLCGTVFLRYQSIEPREPTILPGPVFRCAVRRVMGSNPQFEHVSIDLLNPPVTGGLYLYNPGHTRALALLQLVQIREAPQPVCYFYNRLDSSGPHLVSYHFGDQSNVIDSRGDIELLIHDLSSPPV